MDQFIVQESFIDYENFPGVVYQCQFDKNQYTDALGNALEGELPTSVRNSVLKRRAEFVAGRYAAGRALGTFKTENTHVPIGQDRMPVWPNSFQGSISHTDKLAICAVTREKYVTGVGIDVEKLIDTELVHEIASTIMRPEELAFVETVSNTVLGKKLGKKFGLENSYALLVTLIFSSKESLFKALYPSVGYYFDFSAARLVLIDLYNRYLHIELAEDLTPKYKEGFLMKGHFEIEENNIITYLTI